MGRHRKHPTDQGNVKKPIEFTGSETVNEDVEERLFGKTVCTSCATTNPPDADKCRNCDSTQLRDKKRTFSNNTADDNSGDRP